MYIKCRQRDSVEWRIGVTSLHESTMCTASRLHSKIKDCVAWDCCCLLPAKTSAKVFPTESPWAQNRSVWKSSLSRDVNLGHVCVLVRPDEWTRNCTSQVVWRISDLTLFGRICEVRRQESLVIYITAARYFILFGSASYWKPCQPLCYCQTLSAISFHSRESKRMIKAADSNSEY